MCICAYQSCYLLVAIAIVSYNVDMLGLSYDICVNMQYCTILCSEIIRCFLAMYVYTKRTVNRNANCKISITHAFLLQNTLY